MKLIIFLLVLNLIVAALITKRKGHERNNKRDLVRRKPK